MKVRTITAAIAVAATVSLAPGAAIASAASPQAGYVATGGVSAVHTAAAKWHFVGVFPAKQACQVTGRYYMRVGYAKGYKCKKILVGPLHRLYVLR